MAEAKKEVSSNSVSTTKAETDNLYCAGNFIPQWEAVDASFENIHLWLILLILRNKHFYNYYPPLFWENNARLFDYQKQK